MTQGESLALQQRFAFRWLPYGIAALATLLTLLLWYVFVTQTDAHLNQVVKLQSQNVINDLHTQLEHRISALKPRPKSFSNKDIIQLLQSIHWNFDTTDYALTIFNHQVKIYQVGSRQIDSKIKNFASPFDFAGNTLILELQPSDHLISTLQITPSWLILLLGLSVSILFAYTLHFAQTTKEKNKSLEAINTEIKREISHRIQAEESKQKMEKALLQGQKLQAIGTLAGGIAHDFNNLLYAIKGYVEMAREDVAHDTLIYNNLGKVLEAANRGQELVSRILVFSRRQHHELKPISVKQTIESVLSLLKPTIPSSATIDFESTVVDCFILGNQTQLHQIIVNICNNAVDAMEGEGKIHIKMSHVSPNDESFKHLPRVPLANYCKIDITDTGHGMDAATIERIFEPFYTTKEVGKGTGLGLATVHAIVKEHQGEIWVKSQLGQGSTFTILLPECNEQENANGENITR